MLPRCCNLIVLIILYRVKFLYDQVSILASCLVGEAKTWLQYTSLPKLLKSEKSHSNGFTCRESKTASDLQCFFGEAVSYRGFWQGFTSSYREAKAKIACSEALLKRPFYFTHSLGLRLVIYPGPQIGLGILYNYPNLLDPAGNQYQYSLMFVTHPVVSQSRLKLLTGCTDLPSLLVVKYLHHFKP